MDPRTEYWHANFIYAVSRYDLIWSTSLGSHSKRATI